MKTPVQELIEEMKANSVAGEMFWIKQPEQFYEKYLAKEKEQICNSYVEGLEGLYMGAEEYYDKTYNQNK